MDEVMEMGYLIIFVLVCAVALFLYVGVLLRRDLDEIKNLIKNK